MNIREAFYNPNAIHLDVHMCHANVLYLYVRRHVNLFALLIESAIIEARHKFCEQCTDKWRRESNSSSLQPNYRRIQTEILELSQFKGFQKISHSFFHIDIPQTVDLEN